MSSNNTVLVTGAGGFIGARLVEVLHLTQMYVPRAGVRRWSSCARIGRFPIDIAICDILDEKQVDHSLYGVSTVIHCAYGTQEATVNGTRILLDAAYKRGIDRFVHLSTTEVYGDVDGKIDEDYPYQYTGNEYGDSKIEAEKICLEFMKKGLPITILRPSVVYGPFSRYWTEDVVKVLLAGGLGQIQDYGNGICNLLYVDDLIRAIMHVLRNEDAVRDVFNVNGPEPVTWNDYFSMFNTFLGLPEPRKISAANAKLKALASEPVRILGRYLRNNHLETVSKIAEKHQLAKKLMSATEKSIKNTPSLGELSLFSRNAVYETSKAREILGFVPKFGIEHGLRESCDWVRHHGFLIRPGYVT